MTLLTKLRATGMPIRMIREYAELVRAGDGNEARAAGAAARPTARACSSSSTAVRRNLEAIEYKIDFYRGRYRLRLPRSLASPKDHQCRPSLSAARA